LKLLPDLKFTPIEQGIRETVQWFVEHYGKPECRGTAQTAVTGPSS